MDLDIDTINRLVSVFIPLAVGLATKKLASGLTKAMVLAALASLTGFLTQAIDNDGHILLNQTIDGIIDSVIVAAGMYYGVLKPSGIAAAVQNLKPDTGLGTAQVAVPPKSTAAEVAEPLGAPPPTATKPKAKKRRKG